MLGNFERRYFTAGEKIWYGRYYNLVNVLHWHFENEIIRIVKGHAKLMIGDMFYDAEQGDCFFCAGEELHYIISDIDTCVDIIITEKSIAKDITDMYTLEYPKLPTGISSDFYFDNIKKEFVEKGTFYRESLEIQARALILEFFKKSKICKHNEDARFYNGLIKKINEEFASITFEDAASYAGYSHSYFSKIFKKLAGMSFTDYLNVIKIENAIMMMRRNPHSMISAIAAKCGFTTLRNFNRVFKEITGYSPRDLPSEYVLNAGIQIVSGKDFDPTNPTSVVIDIK